MSAQDAFAAALLDPARPAPAGLTDPAGRPAGARFDVYRNNVAASLTAALETGFPVLRRLLGAEFFAAMAGVFLRAHPPRGRLLMTYGTAMPGFLEAFPPVAHLPYLPDVAQLELARRQAYHAADAAPLDAGALAALPPDRLTAARLRLAPALRLVRSDWPVAAIWHANTTPGAPPPGTGAQDALVTRPGYDPEVAALGPGEGAFVAALMAGAHLGAAHEAGAATPGFDLTQALGRLLAGGAITGIEEESA